MRLRISKNFTNLYNYQELYFRPLCISGKKYHFDFRDDECDHPNYLDDYFDDVNNDNLY
jgi:hypothetical protein